MPSTGSVTHWIGRLKAGDPEAPQKLWEAYFQRLVRLARGRLRAAPRRAADEEDVALSAFDSFCRGVESGRYPSLTDRDSLWRLLVVITRRKAFDLINAQNRLKNGAGRRPSALALDDLPAAEPTPEFVALMADQCRHLFARLEDPELQTIARRKMEGYTSAEIAALHRCSLTRIERKLRLIRKVWEHRHE
jgi:DNA-directed RNA polymerase specialized sigma24 family protein